MKIEALAISFLHSYINPIHEERARDLLTAALPGLAITISSEVCREIREYERTSTTVALSPPGSLSLSFPSVTVM